MNRFSLLLFFAFFLSSCGDAPPPTPKPRAFPRVQYPEKAYQQFDKDYCSFTFEYPEYAEVQQDKNFFDEAPPHPCWFDIYFKDFDSRLYLSYAPISSKENWEDLRNDAFNLADWHNKKASYIDEMLIQKENGVSGVLFLIEGHAASPAQFYLTDSTNHFLRASLYFNSEVRPDSMAPVYKFLEADIIRMIETFEWTE